MTNNRYFKDAGAGPALRARRFARLTMAIATVMLVSAPVVLPAQELSAAESRRILQRVDDLVTYPEEDFSAEYTVTEVRPGESTSRTQFVLFRRDRADSYTILIQEPAQDRGKGYLRIDDNLWLYDPVARRFTVVSASDRFENTGARNSDFNQSTLADDYRIVGHTTEQLGAYQTDVYDMEATHDDVTFPFMRIWIDQNRLVRKFEDYSLSRRHMRTTAVPNYRRLGDQYVPVRIVIQDELRGREVDGRFRNQRTMIEVEKPSLQEVPNMVFTRTFLERAGD
ncbi:MAG TPA: outer membrane lipoprotein-sorting protein [Alkalispirochaeta sp.]|nr:outer membrane lipoprotein-sorting protein [Alkalispirochaeta sp.]